MDHQQLRPFVPHHLPTLDPFNSPLHAPHPDPQPALLCSLGGEMLPNLNISLDDALTKFNSRFSPLESPLEWLEADKNHIDSIIQEIAILTGETAEIGQVNFAGAMTYQHLIIYLYIHLMLCTHDEKLFNNFKETLKEWQGWNIITAMQNHQLVRNFLSEQFRCNLQCGQIFSHSESLFEKLLTLDVIALSAQLVVVLKDKKRYNEFEAQRGSDAQALLNLLQARFSFTINSKFKTRHLKALIALSQASNLHPECFVLNEIEIERHPKAGGGFGDVFKGNFQGQQIAVKILRIYQELDMTKLRKELLSEAVIWQQLSHPNVLPFYGVYHLDWNPTLSLVSPWMDNGNIMQFLANQASDIDCIPLVLDVAQGLEYLHHEKIIHGDLKGVNVLVLPSQRACLADFGLAIARGSTTTLMTSTSTRSLAGTLRWQAPELFHDIITNDTSMELCKTFATDIYAFAMVCYEMFSGNVPFHFIRNDISVVLAVKQGKRPSKLSYDLHPSRGLNDEVWGLIQTCWATEPSNRPSASQIVMQLCTLPNQSLDQRPLDNFNHLLSSQGLNAAANNPFSLLATVMEDTNNM